MSLIATAASQETVNDAANRRLADEVWTRGDLAACDDLVHQDWELHQPSAGSEIGRGPDGYRRWVSDARSAFPDLQLIPEDQFCLGDRVATRWTIRGTHAAEFAGSAPTGRVVEWTAVSIKRFAGGKVVETWICTDGLALLRQIGALPGNAQPAGW